MLHECKSRFWQIFVEGLEEFPIVIIQSETSTSTHEYSENCHASIAQCTYVYSGIYVMLLSNFRTKIVGSVSSRRLDFTLNWYVYLFSWLV